MQEEQMNCLPIVCVCVYVCVWAAVLWICYFEGFVCQIRRTPYGFNKKRSHIRLVYHETAWLCFHALNSPDGFACTW